MFLSKNMNYKVVLNVVGKTMFVLGVVMCLPLVVSFIYADGKALSFLFPVIGLLALGLPLSFIKCKDDTMNAKEGFVIVAACWVLMSLIGCVPFMLSGEIPNFFDAFFETVSGFTTTGSTVLSLNETGDTLSKSVMFWRVFTHWIGGMGVLVFVLAVLPSDGKTMHVFRAESPGPSASKLVSKIGYTARILYFIYIALTLLLTLLLSFSGMGFYDSLLNAFSAAGTGGFGIYGTSIMHYNSAYVEIVLAVFMFLFSINFNLYYMILIGKVSKALKSEEFIWYSAIILLSTLVIAVDISSSVGGFLQGLRYAFFQTTSVSSTTGSASADFYYWPTLSKCVLLLLTVVGACGGSTGGGIKVSRLIILSKTGLNGVKKSLHPRSVNTVKLEGEPLSKDIQNNTVVYMILWLLIVIVSTLLLSFDVGEGKDLFTHFSATLTCIGNVGPGLTKLIGPMGNFASYNGFSKIVLSLVMLAGRLEIIPMIILFAPNTWRRGK